jgi:hypothetical protein
VHLLGLHALLTAISERVAVYGREDEIAQALVSRLRHVSTFYHLQPLEPEVSRLLVVGPKRGGKQTMKVDPVIEQLLNLDLHPSTLTFLFPRVLADMQDSNMYQQGRILTVLYENNLNEYLDMRSMANMIHKRLNWIIRTYFAAIPTSPMEAWLQQPSSPSMVSVNFSRASPSGIHYNAEAQEEWTRIYGPILARRGNQRSREYASRNYLDLLIALKNQLEAHEQNTRNYETWDRLSSAQRVFYVWASLTQIFGQAQQLHNRIQEGRAFQAALQAARNARANASQAFDPEYVAAQPPRGPTANNRNFLAREAEGIQIVNNALVRYNQEEAQREEAQREEAETSQLFREVEGRSRAEHAAHEAELARGRAARENAEYWKTQEAETNQLWREFNERQQREAQANTMAPYDPSVVAAQGPRGPTGNERNFMAREAEGTRIVNAVLRANESAPYDPSVVAAQGPRGPTANNRNFGAREAEGNARTNAAATRGAMESIYGDVVNTFGEVSDFRDGVSSNANGLPARAREAVEDADADIHAR